MSEPESDLYQFLTQNGIAKDAATLLSSYCTTVMGFRSVPDGIDASNPIDFFLAGPPTSLITARAAFPTNGIASQLDADTDATTFKGRLDEAVAGWIAELPKKPAPNRGHDNRHSSRGRHFRA
jgi:hypothetical protein